jgi:sulfur carrier protein
MSGPGIDTSGRSVDIVVNGERLTVAPDVTLDALIDLVGSARRGVAVAVDGTVVPRSEWPTRTLAHGARVEIVTATAGG